MPARGAGHHDSQEDAVMAMRLVTHELARTTRTAPLEPPPIKVRAPLWEGGHVWGVCM